MTRVTKDTYDNIDDDIDFILNQIDSLPYEERSICIKTRLLNSYNSGRWDFYLEEINQAIKNVGDI
jgi:hypothetical protein